MTGCDDVEAAARRLVGLFVWEPDEETGAIVPHLHEPVPDFYATVTSLRDALEHRDREAAGAARPLRP